MDGNTAMANAQENARENELEPKIFRCGWCGAPADENGTSYAHGSEAFNKTANTINEHGDKFTTLVHGDCCAGEHG